MAKKAKSHELPNSTAQVESKNIIFDLFIRAKKGQIFLKMFLLRPHLIPSVCFSVTFSVADTQLYKRLVRNDLVDKWNK